MSRQRLPRQFILDFFRGADDLFVTFGGRGGGGVLGAVAALVFSFFPNVSISGNMYL